MLHRLECRYGCAPALLVWLAIAGPIQAEPPSTQPSSAACSQPASQPAPPRETASRPIDRFWTGPRLLGDWGQARTELESVGIGINPTLQQQTQKNFRGGERVHNGHRFTGSYDLKFDIDFERMGLANGLGFAFEAKGTMGDGITPTKVGSLYEVNADAGGDFPIFVRKWWLRQLLFDDKLELRIGMLETNKDLVDVSLYANHEDKDFMNLLSIRNVTVPHRTGLGLFAKAQPTSWFYVQGAVVDAQSRARRTGFDTAFHEHDWYTALWELGLTPKWETVLGPLPGRYRLGWWYDPRVKTPFESRPSLDRRGGEVGFYLGLDQMVYRESTDPKNTQGLGLFGRLGTADGEVDRINVYWQAGMSYTGLLPTRDRDVLGFSVGQARLSEEYCRAVDPLGDRETVFEWYYSYFLTPWCIISPDFQVVTNPGGDTDDRDAIVGGIRFRLIF